MESGSKRMNKYQLHQLIHVVVTGAKRPEPIGIWKQVTQVTMFIFNWRETGATNQEKLLTYIAKAATFGVNITHDINAIIILASIAMAAQFTSRGA